MVYCYDEENIAVYLQKLFDYVIFVADKTILYVLTIIHYGGYYPPQSVNKRSFYLDYAKSVAIYLMVLLHTTMSYPYLSSTVGAFHMAVFFILGGVFFRIDSVSNVFRKGFLQLMLPYFCFSLIGLFTCWVSPYLHPELYPGLDDFGKIFKAAFYGIFLMQDRVTEYSFMPLGPLWFLPALFWCRLFCSLWFSYRSYFGLLIKCSVIAALLVFYLAPVSYFSLSSVSVSFPFYLLGFYLKDLFLLKIERMPIAIRCLISLGLLILFVLCNGSGIGFDGGVIYGNVVFAYARGISGTLILVLLCSFLPAPTVNRLWKTLSLIGVSTLTILCTHMQMIICFKVLYSFMGFDPGDISIYYATVVSVIIVLAGVAIHRYLSANAPVLVGKGVKFDFFYRLARAISVPQIVYIWRKK